MPLLAAGAGISQITGRKSSTPKDTATAKGSPKMYNCGGLPPGDEAVLGDLRCW